MRANAVVHDSLTHRRVKARQRRLRVLYWSVACLIVLFSVGGILWMLPEDEPVYVTEKIEPGKSKAVLYMASGDVVNVDGQTGVMKEKDGTRIEIDGKEGIAYRVTGGQQQEETLSNRIVIPRGGEFKLILADGTAVWLNSDSELSYPTAFAGQKREVFLRGEAYFDVKPDSLHPFIVHVDEVRIQVRGGKYQDRFGRGKRGFEKSCGRTRGTYPEPNGGLPYGGRSFRTDGCRRAAPCGLAGG